MDEILNQINQSIADKYNELKRDSITYGELRKKISKFTKDIAWNNEKEYTFLVIKKMNEFYDNDVNKVIIKK